MRKHSTGVGWDNVQPLDPEGAFLAAPFNACLHFHRTPASWRHSRTTLIPRKGDLTKPENYQPLSLGNTVAKLYASCLARRMQEWISEHSILSRCEKGFLPYDRVFEHNFVLHERLDAVRTPGGGYICAAFLDFATAFGSVPHNALIDAVRGAGTEEDFARLIEDLYTDNTTMVMSADGPTEPIRIASGIRQGCPLGGLLFNLVVDPVIRAVQGGSGEHNILAYADNLTPLADNPAALQQRIRTVESLAGQLGVVLKPSKCKSIHLSGKTPVGTRPTTFNVNGEAIQTLTDFEDHHFLGRPVGYRVVSDGGTVKEAIETGQKLLKSMLAPWQRLDAIKTCLFPALNFAMRMGTCGRDEWKRLDEALHPLLKKTLYLPANATNDYIYSSSKGEAAGMPNAAETSDACRMDAVFKLLSSIDQEVRDMAVTALKDAVTKRLRRPAEQADIEAFLNGDTEGEFRAT